MDEYEIIKNTLEKMDSNIFLNIKDNGLGVYIPDGIENKNFVKINRLFRKYGYTLKRIDGVSGYNLYIVLQYVVVLWVKKQFY